MTPWCRPWHFPMMIACSGTQTPPPATSGPAWKDMNHEQKLAFMKTVFFPKMKAEFVAFDAKEYESFSCATCHGVANLFKGAHFDLPHSFARDAELVRQ